MKLWYIDESGISKSEKMISLGAFCIDEKNHDLIKETFEKLKLKHFGKIFKIDMKNLISGNNWARGISIDKRKEFLKDFNELIRNLEYNICIYGVIKEKSKKINHKEEFCYNCLFERICLSMEKFSRNEEEGFKGILFSDSVTNIGEVKEWFNSYFKCGTRYVENKHLIEGLHFLKMKNSELLQISDLFLGIWNYFLKTNENQKSLNWAEEELEKGYFLIMNKNITLENPEGGSVSSIKVYFQR